MSHRTLKNTSGFFSVRREYYGDLLGALRGYVRQPNATRLEELTRLFSICALYAGPRLRNYMIQCANAAEDVGLDSIPTCLGGHGLAKLERLMKDELGVPRNSWLSRQIYGLSPCYCGSKKRHKDCHGA